MLVFGGRHSFGAINEPSGRRLQRLRGIVKINTKGANSLSASLIVSAQHPNASPIIREDNMESMAPWIVLAAYCLVTWLVTPRKVDQEQFFDGRNDAGSPPGIWLVAMSAAITWIFAKSIANASDLSFTFGLTGGLGYTIYYLSFVVAGTIISASLSPAQPFIFCGRAVVIAPCRICWSINMVRYAQNCSC
jgi:hypothetical protein